MVDEELLKRLTALGVKRARFSDVDGSVGGPVLLEVEFFPSIPSLDLDTLVPPPGDSEEKLVESPIPAAHARILRRGSVS